MEIKDSTRSALIRKGNELFNQKDIDGAYRCYLTASYFGGIEKIADYYNFILKEDSNLGGNVRAKQKLDKLSESVVKVLRKWLKEDETFDAENKNTKLELDSKNAALPSNYKKNSLEDILKEKEKLDKKAEKDLENNNNDFYSKASNIKKPVFEKIYTNKQNKK